MILINTSEASSMSDKTNVSTSTSASGCTTKKNEFNVSKNINYHAASSEKKFLYIETKTSGPKSKGPYEAFDRVRTLKQSTGKTENTTNSVFFDDFININKIKPASLKDLSEFVRSKWYHKKSVDPDLVEFVHNKIKKHNEFRNSVTAKIINFVYDVFGWELTSRKDRESMNRYIQGFGPQILQAAKIGMYNSSYDPITDKYPILF